MTRALVFFWLAACGGSGTDDTTSSPVEAPLCDALDPTLCTLPWPSSYYQVADPTSASGVVNAFPMDAMPVNRDAVRFDPAQLNEKDGFSVLTPALTYFEDVSLDGVIGHEDLARYADADAKSVLLNAETGERVPHWVELDMNAPEGQRLLAVVPAQPMAHGTRYIVALRGLTTTQGTDVAVSDAFQALKDGTSSLPDRQRHFDEAVFPVLDADGFAKADLQLAWDFTTISQESVLGDIQAMRSDALATLPADGPGYTITSVELGDCAGDDRIGKTIEGSVDVPLYTDVDLPGSILNRDASGDVVRNGDTTADFLIRIPCSLTENPRQTPMLMQYGHGLLGGRGEARTSWLSEFADDNSLVVFAMDWTGMASADAPGITLTIANDLSGFRMIPERSQQGFIELMVGMRMMQTSIVEDPELTLDGVAILDGAPIGYYGNSQGGILGASYMAISPDISRGVLGVPGMPYSVLLNRSADFDPFFKIFMEKYLDHRDITLMIGIMQTLWDAGEPSGYAHALTTQPLPDTPEKSVLIQVGIGDAQVTSLGSHIMARAYGAKTVAPETRPIWGVEEAAPGFTGSALVEYEYTDVPAEPVENVPPDKDFDTHECPRREASGQAQIIDFLTSGTVNQYCDGACISLREGLCD